MRWVVLGHCPTAAFSAALVRQVVAQVGLGLPDLRRLDRLSSRGAVGGLLLAPGRGLLVWPLETPFRCGFDPWVGKIPWRRERLPPPVFWPCDPIDGGPPGSRVPGILQARALEWVAISFSNA